jgi:MerR family transcriptional regulator, copper efflux regulator
MLISEFARATELSPDTVRFYVKRGLLQPAAGRRGGTNPYQEFSEADVAAARLVRLAQSLGFTLGEIAALIEELRATGANRPRHIAILKDRLQELDEKAARIDGMRRYLRAKIAWLKGGEKGPEPPLETLTDVPVAACATADMAFLAPRPPRNRRKPAN